MTEQNKTRPDLPASIRYFDYKDAETLKRFLNPHGRILSRKQTNLAAVSQRRLAMAVKYAREMGFLPYVAK